MSIKFNTINSFISSQTSWKIMGSLAVGGIVCSVAKRSLLEYSRLLPAGLGILASGVSLYILTRTTSKVISEEAREANNITQQLKRNEIVWRDIQIPGLAEHIHKLLLSDRISDVRACKRLMDPKAVVGIQIGTAEEWILPEGVSESESVKIVIGARHQRQTEVLVNKNRCVDILVRLGIEENEKRSFANMTSLAIRIEGSKVSRVTLCWPGNKSETITFQNGAELQFKYVLGVTPLPIPCETYTPKQKQIAEIYLNTLIAKSSPFRLTTVVTNPDFSKVLENLLSFDPEEPCICFGYARYRNGVNLDIIDRVELSKEPFVFNSDEPHLAVFILDKMKELPSTYSIPLQLENRCVHINFESVTRLLTQVAEIMAMDRLQLGSKGSWDIPIELQHDDSKTDEVYKKNVKFLTLYGIGKLGYVYDGSAEGEYSVVLNLTNILNELPKPENIKSIEIVKEKINFSLIGLECYTFTFPEDPRPGDPKRSFDRPSWGK
ncbi:MAG: hypothetical protein KBA81_06495 [Rhabdochlamydiaceae bacterium]|nr:hypothetical protein [Rhabdochlamydiaceae bacterium]